MASFEAGTFPDLPPAMQDSMRDTASVTHSNEDGADYCRICRGEATDEQPLFYPCKCSGSIKYVHQDCLMEWLSHSQKKYCELCKTPFRFTKLYDQSMPPTLPAPLFLRQLVLHSLKGVSRWARYLLVGFIWTCCLPWCIRQVWRGLFWLADGSWISEQELRRANLKNTNTTAIGHGASEIFNASTLISPANSTLQPSEQTLAPLVSLLTAVLRFLSGETLLAKILRFLFSVPPVQLGSSSPSRHSLATARNGSFERPPSLLSDMRTVKALTSSNLVNHASIDVFEGQLICIFLIAAFILVFLIREWVINQQPIPNMPDPDLADNAAVPAQADNAARPAVRRRRGVLRRAVAPNALPAPAAGVVIAARPIAFPRRRRALTDDNIAVPVRREEERPELPVRSASLLPAWPSLEPNHPPDIDTTTNDGHDFSDEPFLPPLMRGALGNAVNIHRTIEEAAGPSDEYAEGLPQPPIEPEANVHPEFESSINQSSSAAVLGAIALADAADMQDEPENYFDTDSSTSVEDILKSVASMEEGSLSGDLGSDSDEAALPTPGSTEGASTAEIAEEETDETEPSSAQIDTAANPQNQQLSLFEKLGAWLWHTDGFIPENPAVGQDDVHVVADIQAEAPFVPVANREAFPPAVARPPQPPPPPPPAREPNIQFGIDLNDPNALDEAEDLDGILELIGMEGPLAGMVQNVIFSLFLITLTLTASVWVPYIWGKIALLFLANPVIVFIKAPLYLLSKGADTIADMVFFVVGVVGYLFNHLTKVVKMITAPILPTFSDFLDTDLIEHLSLNLTHSSGNRLEKALSGTLLTFRPDLPTFSMQSHHALKVFKGRLSGLFARSAASLAVIRSSLRPSSWSFTGMLSCVVALVKLVPTLPQMTVSSYRSAMSETHQLASDLKFLSFNDLATIDHTLVEWSTEDKIIAILLGYCFFATAGFIFLKLAHIVLGLKDDEKVEGTVADSLRQAGGVMKVIVIIGIEMIVFPLYCGFLLDVALLPLFEGATIHTRIAFIIKAPFTGLFIHWFIGTCYMFHFALFVSMCRKIMRKGVLYFIRDPDDPTFHPVRDVLERPVPNQLGKIAFSALVYGALVIVCLGGVVWVLNRVEGLLPIRWATNEPRLAFPVDVIFYNFLLPFMVRKAEPSKKLALIYEWWFRGCASGLRLTHFLFGEERDDEKRPAPSRLTWTSSTVGREGTTPFDGTYVRAPASDACRIPKGQKVFLEVDANNKRLDGQPDQEKGVHGKNDDRFAKIYIPPQFKARVATFVLLLWIFAALTGVASTIGPLIIGRVVVKLLAGSDTPPNDLYAITVGLHLLAAAAYAIGYLHEGYDWLRFRIQDLLSNTRHAAPLLWSAIKYCAGLVYLLASFGIVLPFTLSLISELYIHVPIFTYLLSDERVATTVSAVTLKPPPAVFMLQTWTLGLLYLRLVLRIALTQPSRDSRAATAIRAIVRDGYLRPDVKLASRAVILPATALCIVLLAAPLVYAKVVISLLRISDPQRQMKLYRFAYPGLLGVGLLLAGFISLQRKIALWRVKIRDEVYLIGERLHNFHEVRPKKRRSKGKERVS